MQLYECAVVKNEKKDRDGEVVDAAKILVEPRYELARSSQELEIKLAREIPDDELEHADRIVILVRPF